MILIVNMINFNIDDIYGYPPQNDVKDQSFKLIKDDCFSEKYCFDIGFLNFMPIPSFNLGNTFYPITGHENGVNHDNFVVQNAEVYPEKMQITNKIYQNLTMKNGKILNNIVKSMPDQLKIHVSDRFGKTENDDNNISNSNISNTQDKPTNNKAQDKLTNNNAQVTSNEIPFILSLPFP